MSNSWKMPTVKIGDVVIWSKDYKGFTDQCIGFVMKEPGEYTITVLTFTPAGVPRVQQSCHHKDDPALLEDNGWQDLGVWDYAESTRAIRSLTEGTSSVRKSSGK